MYCVTQHVSKQHSDILSLLCNLQFQEIWMPSGKHTCDSRFFATHKVTDYANYPLLFIMFFDGKLSIFLIEVVTITDQPMLQNTIYIYIYMNCAAVKDENEKCSARAIDVRTLSRKRLSVLTPKGTWRIRSYWVRRFLT